jgi:hypothetical protein
LGKSDEHRGTHSDRRERDCRAGDDQPSARRPGYLDVLRDFLHRPERRLLLSRTCGIGWPRRAANHLPLPAGDVDAAGSDQFGVSNVGGYGAAPTYTGDTFDFIGGGNISRAFDGTIVNGPAGPCEFHITWDETPGNLAASISLLTVDNEIAINNLFPSTVPAGYWVGSDNILGGCFFTLCRMTGFWQETSPVPEPGTIAILAAALALLLIARLRQRTAKP